MPSLSLLRGRLLASLQTRDCGDSDMDHLLKDNLSVFDAHWHEAWDRLCEEANWKSMQAYANHCLKVGCQREGERLQHIMDRIRRNRQKALAKKIVSGAYEAIRK